MKTKFFPLNLALLISLLLIAPASGQENNTLNESIQIINENLTDEENNSDILLPQILQEGLTNKEETKKEFLSKHKEKIHPESYETIEQQDNLKLIAKYSEGFDDNKYKKNIQAKNPKFNTLKIQGKYKDIAKIIEDNDIEYIEIDQNLELQEITTNIQQIKADTAWNHSTGQGIKIGVLDTGITNHSQLTIQQGYNAITNTTNTTDIDGHGTAITGILASALDGQAIAGVSPNANIYAIKIIENGQGTISDAINGLEWAINNNISIIVMSFGFSSYSQIFKEAAQTSYQEGMLLFAAAGNNNTQVVYPAAYDNVIAVGAVNASNNRASFSNYGLALELTAPGVNINTTSTNNDYAVITGTSAATPHAAGIAALIWANQTNLTNEQVRAKLRNDALDLGSPGRDDYYGYGLVQANLTTDNYAFNQSYYYEVYNVTNYSTPNETMLFWTNGTGSVDDLNYTVGYYFIHIEQDLNVYEYYQYVDENGTISELTNQIEMNDTFSSDGSSQHDGKAWLLDDETTVNLDTPGTGVEALCYDFDDDNTYDNCLYKSGKLNSCKTYSQGLGAPYNAFYQVCQNTPSKCTQDDSLRTGFSLDTNQITETEVDMRYWKTCSSSGGFGANTQEFFVFDRRRAICKSSTTYDMQGRYDTSPDKWEPYKTSLTCSSGKECDYAIDDENVSSGKGYVINPCRKVTGQSCTLTNECLTGLTCTGGVCSGAATVDLSILDIIPIQVIPGVNMIVNKTGYVRVIVKNTGVHTVNATVNLLYDGSPLSPYNPPSGRKEIPANTNTTYDFNFKPPSGGNNKIINANVTIT